MAIAFDNAVAAQQFITPGTTLTWSHTVTGSNPSLFVGFGTFSVTDVITSVTYNGVAMTRAAVVNDASNGEGLRWVYMYVLPNCATGANNVVITASAPAFFAAASASYTGTNTSSQPDGFNTQIDTSTGTSDVPVSVTTSVSGSWGIMFGAEGRSFLAGTGATMRAVNSNNQSGMIDSTTAFSGTGSNNIKYKSNATGGQNVTLVIVGIKPPVAAPQANGFFLATML